MNAGERMVAAMTEAGYPPTRTDVRFTERAVEWRPPPPIEVWEKARRVCAVGDAFDPEELIHPWPDETQGLVMSLDWVPADGVPSE